eukprot:TRINITY_DN10182_c0_g2_i3.p1 TRINITY_DN10182_c0_g2~~TRINITY_DN10182_c0_g2_i3.p1  ORF type:complete len:263 (+),score=57.21 TRINITY_DN10182_c0_g2_i3:456-1244(+)
MDDARAGFYWDHLPFEVHQGFLLCLPVLRALYEEIDSSRLFRIAMIGGGGAVVPMTLIHHFEAMLEQCTVCEISMEVMTAAKEWFGLQECDKLHACVEDGVTHLQQADEGQYDCLICDALDPDAVEGGLEAPAGLFVDTQFVQQSVLHCLSRRGIYMANVMGEIDNLLQVSDTFNVCFTSTFVLAMDPNVLFVGFKSPMELSAQGLLHQISAIPELANAVCDIVSNYIVPSTHKELEPDAMGWYTLSDYVSLVQAMAVAEPV